MKMDVMPALLVVAALIEPMPQSSSSGASSAHDHHHAAVEARGARVMGFDQQRTVHRFRLHPDGGAIDVAVKDSADHANRDAIRAHLPRIASMLDRKSTRLNSSHGYISYAVFCLKKKNK